MPQTERLPALADIFPNPFCTELRHMHHFRLLRIIDAAAQRCQSRFRNNATSPPRQLRVLPPGSPMRGDFPRIFRPGAIILRAGACVCKLPDLEIAAAAVYGMKCRQGKFHETHLVRSEEA